MPSDCDITDAPRESLRKNIVAAYVAAGAKVFAWAAVSRLVFGGGTHLAEYALLALIRSTLGILNYTGLGLAPALIHFLSFARHASAQERDSHMRRLYANALILAFWLGLLGILATCAYALLFPHIHRVPLGLLRPASMAGLLMGVGLVLRLMSDAPSAWLQACGRFTFDNLLLVAAELLWVLLTAALLHFGASPLPAAGLGFAASSLLLLVARRLYAAQGAMLAILDTALFDRALCLSLLSFGSLITLSLLADFLYAPMNCILINRLLAPADLAAYTVAIQVDAALLLVSAGLSAALLPRAAALLSRGQHHEVRRHYWRLTAVSLLALLSASVAAWLLASWWLPLWLKSDLPSARLILPWVLVHTVIGGSSAIGRAVLIAGGHVRALSASTLIAGTLNVVLSYSLARYAGMGLRGIVLGTIIVVSARCLLWMPWYVLRTTRPPVT